MGLSTIEGSLSVKERISCKFLDYPANSLDETALKSSAQLPATALQHQHRARHSDPAATTTTTTIVPIFAARFAGTLVDLFCGNVAPCIGGATIVVDLKKNNVSVLTGTLTLTSANAARVGVTASLNPASVAYVAGDLFELHLTAAAGGGTIGTGFFGFATFNERSQ